MTSKISIFNDYDSQSDSVPYAPRYILPYHFNCDNLLKSFQFINNYLNSCNDIAFKQNNKYHWNVLICNNRAVMCHIEIHIFKKENYYIIECNRLSGDPIVFHNFFRHLHAIFDSSVTNEEIDFSPGPLPVEMQFELTDEEARKAIEPIINMLYDENIYNKRMGATVLCDMSNDIYLHTHMVQCDCISHLAKLTEVNDDQLRLIAYITISNLSKSNICILTIKNMLENNSIKYFIDDNSNEESDNKSHKTLFYNFIDKYFTNIINNINNNCK